MVNKRKLALGYKAQNQFVYSLRQQQLSMIIIDAAAAFWHI
ncbi:hypothetical protein [Lactonifactor sp. BIOML-A7]|nr:hypothetical protein [Lactonifactor sp. BIOML-A7]